MPKTPIQKNPVWYFLLAFFIGIFGLFSFYIILLSFITGDINHPFVQFRLYQPWMSILIIGFGIQTGLFWLLRKIHVAKQHDAEITAGTSATVSGVSMVACCTHHVVEILSILGISSVALFFSEYQKELLILGVIVNTIGIIYMFWLFFGKENQWKYLS